MDPIYTPHNTQCAYQLNWGITLFWRHDAIDDGIWFESLKEQTEQDGVRLLKYRQPAERTSQFFVSTRPNVSPMAAVRCVKGRLQYLLRQETGKAFKRNYCIRSIGSADRQRIDEYIAKQLEHHPMADPLATAVLDNCQRTYVADLSEPSFTKHGQYWYNLHLVLTNAERWCEVDPRRLEQLIRGIEQTAKKYQERLGRIGTVADHLHFTTRCRIDRSPEETALSYMNNCAFLQNMRRIFSYGFYAGTFGEYDRGAID